MLIHVLLVHGCLIESYIEGAFCVILNYIRDIPEYYDSPELNYFVLKAFL